MSDPARDGSGAGTAEAKPVIVKKYANRRLYNTESSSYITLENLAEMVRQGRDFVVKDAKTGEDITRQVLTQIIVEEEGKGAAMLPTNFLRQLIGFYGEDMQGLVPRYLEQAMDMFARQQEQVRASMQQAMNTLLPPGMASAAPLTGGLMPGFEEMGRRNMAMMERAMNLFSPFGRAAADTPGAASPGAPTTPPQGDSEEVIALRAEVEKLRRELAAIRTPVESPKKNRGD